MAGPKHSTLNRRKFVIGSASALGLSLVLPRAASAAVGAWASQQGGSQDLQTGIVWLDYKLLTGAEPTYSENLSLAAALVHEGYDDWRVPTLAEMLAAVDHEVSQNCPLWDPTANFKYWSSTTAKGKNVYIVNLRDGSKNLVSTNGTRGPGGQFIISHLFGIYVRQGTL